MTENSPQAAHPTLDALVNFYQTLSLERLPDLENFYAEKARFVDPFNDVIGHAAIRKIFADMFEKLTAPRFIVTGRFLADPGFESGSQESMLLWQLRFRSRAMGRDEQSIEGSTRLVFDDEGKVILHRDYWDAAGELYAKIPLLKFPVRLLSRCLAS